MTVNFNRRNTVCTVEIKLKRNWNETVLFHPKHNARPWNVLAVLANTVGSCCLSADAEAAAGRWRMRDVVVVSAG